MINITKTYLPPLEEYVKNLKKIWDSGWVTNNGQLLVELENKLKEYLGVKHLFIVTNGTMALEIAIKALDLKGEVITTPFSYVATTSSLVWEGCKPVFADIDKETLNIDSREIEKRITPETSGMMPVHVYGNICDVEKIKDISEKYNLPIIYDAAHAFGAKYNGESILKQGDISILSFHATKLFHMIEGGAVITDNDDLAHKISYLRNFGHKNQEEFFGLGINGKNSEFHAAMGLSVLSHIEEILKSRKEITELYDGLLDWGKLIKPTITQMNGYNYAYYPVIFDSEEVLLKVKNELNRKQIFPRRYFFPSLNSIEYIKEFDEQEMPIAEDISRRILCLPLYHDLKMEEIKLISEILNKNV